MDGTARPVTSDYDSHGNRVRITHPDGQFFEYAYDAPNNLMFISENRKLPARRTVQCWTLPQMAIERLAFDRLP